MVPRDLWHRFLVGIRSSLSKGGRVLWSGNKLAEAWRQEIMVYSEAEYGCCLEYKENNERLGRANYKSAS